MMQPGYGREAHGRPDCVPGHGYGRGYGPGHGMMGGGYGPGYGSGMMGRGYGYGRGQGRGPGYGMMDNNGPGYGPGMMGNDGRRFNRGPWTDGANNRSQQNFRGQENYRGQVTVNLTTDNVKDFFERLIAGQGNKRLKVGDVKEKDADTIVADIVTKDNSLVQRFAVDRHNGFYKPEEE